MLVINIATGGTMKRYIQTAEYKRYNANNRGTHTSDCVKRALSMAFDISYVEVGKELNAIMKQTGRKAWNENHVFWKFIQNHAGKFLQGADNTKTLEETVDELGSGTYIYETSPKPGIQFGRGDHLVCSIDGKIFDSWDSRTQYVTGYWKVEGRNALELSGIEEHLSELSEEAQEAIRVQVTKYFDKHNLHDIGGWGIVKVRQEGYTIYIDNRIKLYPDGPEEKPMTYSFTIAYVFKPNTSLEEARKQIKQVTQTRIYDRFYTIIKQLADHREAMELFKQAGHEKHDGPFLPYRGLEERFFNSLPGWVKPFVTYVSIQEPGAYSDSYELTILPLPGDPRRERISFEGYDSKDIRAQLDIYKTEDFARPGEDYSVYERI